MFASPHSSIQSLVELARRDGGDIRPTLVRALADLFVQQPTHAPAERARFAELTCRLLDGVDAGTRAAVAERLAGYAGTPAIVAAKLARDDIRVADPVLRRCTVLGEAELHSILDSCGVAHAIAIAARRNLPVSVGKRLRRIGANDHADDRPLRADASPPAAPHVPALTFALARRYLVTGTEERQRILSALPACPPVEHEERLRRIERGFGERLERAALRHRPQEFVSLLQQRTKLSADLAARAVADATGEPIVAICRALELPFNMTARIVLFLNPAIGASVQQVFALAGSFEEVTPAAARRLVAAWCELEPPTKTVPRQAAIQRATRDARPASDARVIRARTPARPAAAS